MENTSVHSLADEISPLLPVGYISFVVPDIS